MTERQLSYDFVTRTRKVAFEEYPGVTETCYFDMGSGRWRYELEYKGKVYNKDWDGHTEEEIKKIIKNN